MQNTAVIEGSIFRLTSSLVLAERFGDSRSRRTLRFDGFALRALATSLLFFAAIACPAQRVTITWEGQQLGSAFDQLTNAQSVSLWLDRRVDPSRVVNEEFNDVQVHKAIRLLAAKYQLGAIDLGQVVYIGPQPAAQGLAALLLRARADAARATPSMKKRWLSKRPVAWPRLSQPRRLLEASLQEAGIAVEGLELVPHDLWQTKVFPEMSLVDRTVLTLVGFDLTCEITNGGRRCLITGIKHPLPDHTNRLQVTRPSPKPKYKKEKSKQLFSLKLANQPVGRVVDQLADQLGLSIVWDEASLKRHQRSKETLVSCEVKNADLNELLTEILKPAGFDHSLDDARLKILGAP